MTLILSVATPDAVLQVSDRQLVHLRTDGTVQRAIDEKNKAVIFCDRIAFAYTGLAELGPRRQRTDEWIASVIAPAKGQFEALQALAEAADARFAHPLVRRLSPNLKLHEFVGVGWARFPPSHSTFEPYIACVSNCRTDDGRPSRVRSRFRIYITRTSQDQPALAHAAGQPVAEAENMLRTALGRYVSSGRDVEVLAESLVMVLRSVAERNRLVGAGCMLTCLPRAAIEARTGGELLMLVGGPMKDVSTFMSIPAGEFRGVSYGPIAACGGSIVSDFQAHAL